jgi:elongation factor P--beta-lysine ligase
MAKAKTDNQFDDAKGNTHKHFTDGRSEIYIGGFDQSAQYAEVTDAADEAVNRKRFIKTQTEPVADSLMTRDDPEESVAEFEHDIPGIASEKISAED